MIDPIPVHAGLAPADHGYDELEVDPWPHVHVWDDTEGGDDRPVVMVRLVRYRGWPLLYWSSEERAEVGRWTIVVRPPSQLVRLLSLGRITLEGRVEAAVETLRDRWDDLVEKRLAAWMAAATYGDRGAER